jgi:hypothetical protein
VDAWFEPWIQSGQDTKDQHSLAMAENRRRKAQNAENQHSLAMAKAKSQLETTRTTSFQTTALHPVAHGRQHSLSKSQFESRDECSGDVGGLATASLEYACVSPSVSRTTSSPPVVSSRVSVGHCLIHGAQCPLRLLCDSTAQSSLCTLTTEAHNATKSLDQIPDNPSHSANQVHENHVRRGFDINAREMMRFSLFVLTAALWVWNSGIVSG